MVTNMKKLALIAAVMAPFSAASAAAPVVASKDYVDSGLIQKQNRLTGSAASAASGNVAVWGANGDTAGYLEVDTTVTGGSNNLVTSGAVQTAIASVVAGSIGSLGKLAEKDTVTTSDIDNSAVTLAKIAASAYDTVVTSDSSNLITSGAVYTAIQAAAFDDSALDIRVSDLESGKADKVASATAGHFAGLDSDGNLTDSGFSSSSFDAAGAAAIALSDAKLYADGLAADYATSDHVHASSDLTDAGATGISLVGASDAAAARSIIGATGTGSSVMTASDAGAARTAIGAAAASDFVCSDGQMLLANASGGFDCIEIETGTYSEI
ncbi:MAG: hypothetical protein FWE50_00060 [Alphaproteobacteria bacterium]|nr:hypothetical protein [Alphaproteobacteria bacterium]